MGSASAMNSVLAAIALRTGRAVVGAGTPMPVPPLAGEGGVQPVRRPTAAPNAPDSTNATCTRAFYFCACRLLGALVPVSMVFSSETGGQLCRTLGVNPERLAGRLLLNDAGVAAWWIGLAPRRSCQYGKFQGITARIVPSGRKDT